MRGLVDRALCLTQGVASFMEYKCVEAVFPEMNGRALFQLSVTPMGARRLLCQQSSIW